MVVDHIKKDSHTRFVAFIDESLIHAVRTVSLVQSEIETRIVSPTVVSVELLHRHQLDGIEAQTFQIPYLLHRPVQVACSSEVAQQQFVDHQVLFIGYPEVFDLPVISILPYLEHRSNADSPRRILFRIGIGRRGNVFIIIRIEYLTAVSIGQTKGLPFLVPT